MTGSYAPSIELARLYEHTSARGTKYLLGRIGAARIVLLPGDPTEDGTATWRLLVQERAAEADHATAAPALASRRRPPYAAQRHGGDGGAGDPRPFDDEIPL